MGLGQDRRQRRRRDQEPHFPAGEGEHLAGRTDLHRPLAHAGQGHQRPVNRAVEHHLLPDLVADGDGVEADAELRQQRQVRRPGNGCRLG